jgi:hypothetical protein
MSDLLLTKLYHNPKTGLISASKLYHKAKAIDPSITLKQIKEWYVKQSNIQEHQEKRKNDESFKIVSHNPNSWQMDLAFLLSAG